MSKKQWKNVTDNLSLQFSTRSAWSQEEVDAPTVDVNEIRSNLPTKTSATRQITDLESITANGPFLLNFANIPYEATEGDLKNFFHTFDIINVVKSDQRRGTGMIEFREFNGLAGALNMNEKVFINRPIRLTVGNKDDLARLQASGATQRNRFQNQQRPQQSSTMSDDSENWRARKSQQPTPQPPMDSGNASKEKTNWRAKPTPRISNEKSSPMDTTDNWRRPKSVETKTAPPAATPPQPKSSSNFYRPQVALEQRENPSRSITTPSLLTNAPPTQRSESSRDSESGKESKKTSIFGEAKPVDTIAKDLEIEMKIESIRTSAPKASAWGTKRPPQQQQSSTNVPLVASSSSTSSPSDTKSSSTLEWRVSGPTGAASQRNKTHSDSQRDTKPDQQQQQQEATPVVKPVEPVPAPIPEKNIWAERMKSKVVPSPASQPQHTQIQQSPAQPDRNSGNSEATSPAIVGEKPPTETVVVEQVAASTTAVASSSTCSSAVPVVSQSEKATHQKPPVVISANGPFLDPKSHHTSSSSASASAGNYARAVPLATINTAAAATSTIAANKDASHPPQCQPQQQQPIAKGATSTVSQPGAHDVKSALPSAVKSCGTQSSWAKGPPKGLIEKAEINQ